MRKVYFDNAATTALAPEVFEAMKPYFMEKFGNPSSIHSYGREVRLAIENARKLGFVNGAALYPMVTMNGEECHNEWEITFEEIHRNGAIAFAIYNMIIRLSV